MKKGCNGRRNEGGCVEGYSAIKLLTMKHLRLKKGTGRSESSCQRGGAERKDAGGSCSSGSVRQLSGAFTQIKQGALWEGVVFLL